MLNAAAERAGARGLRVGYHNHAHELEAVIDGQTGLELLASLLDPRVVLEVDLYWATRAGHYAHRQHLAGNTIEGKAVRAMCGVYFVPTQDHDSLPCCPTCRERLEELPPGPWADGE